MDITVLAIALFILYVFGLSSASSLFGCRLKLLQSNIYFKHLATFGYILFISIYANQAFAASSFWQLFGYALLLYLGFIMTTRIHYVMLFIVLVLLMVVYVFGIKEKNTTDEEEKSRLKQQQLYAAYGVALTTAVGVVHYYLKQRAQKKDKFTLMKFIFGGVKCDSAK
jgi:hypothetical protein